MTEVLPLTVGVLALQGDFEEHIAVLERLGVRAVEVRLPEELEQVDALIIPGGESTTISRLLRRWDLFEPVRQRIKQGMPVWGTCAGAILLAERCYDSQLDGLRLMDIEVERNAYGRQVDSFESVVAVPALGPEPLRAIFIRAPRIVRPGAAVEVLARLGDGSVIAARQSGMLVTTFHPELTDDRRWHEFFLRLARETAHRRAGVATMD